MVMPPLDLPWLSHVPGGRSTSLGTLPLKYIVVIFLEHTPVPVSIDVANPSPCCGLCSQASTCGLASPGSSVFERVVPLLPSYANRRCFGRFVRLARTFMAPVSMDRSTGCAVPVTVSI